MLERDVASTPSAESDSAAPFNETAGPSIVGEATSQAPIRIDTPQTRWEARRELAWHRAETERLRVLVEFLSRPIHAHGGAEPDPDIITAYNLAVEAALQGIRRAAQGR